MKIRSFAAAAMAFGAAGVAVTAALMTSAAAHADDSWSLPVPPFANQTFYPSASEGLPTDVTGIPGLYTTENIPWSTVDGSFVTQDTEIGSQPYLYYVSEKVIDSTGVAPAVGTEWENFNLAVPIPVPPGVVGGLSTIPIGVIQNSSLTTPDGTVDNLISPLFGFANNYYDGPAGLFDYLVFSNGTSVPLINMPTDAASAAATELAGATDAATLWSDLTAML